MAPEKFFFFLFFSTKNILMSYLFISTKTYVVGTHLKYIVKALLMSTHNICFCAGIRKLLRGYPLLSGAMLIQFYHGIHCLQNPDKTVNLQDNLNMRI